MCAIDTVGDDGLGDAAGAGPRRDAHPINRAGRQERGVKQQLTMKFKTYKPELSLAVDGLKGVLDVDTVKGCACGMAKYQDGGCYGLCYAYRTASLYGIDFTKSVSRQIPQSLRKRREIEIVVRSHRSLFFRIGTMGDPCHDWDLTIKVCRWLGKIKTPVIVSKHWVSLSDLQMRELKDCGAVVNVSISALDSPSEVIHRLKQFDRLRATDIPGVLWIVSCNFGSTEAGKFMAGIQAKLFTYRPHIDNPLRIPSNDPRVLRGDILVEKHANLGGGSYLSRTNPQTYIGRCEQCPDQCGVRL